MTKEERDGERLSPRDAQFVQRVAEGFAPPPRSEARQQAFRRILEERLRRPSTTGVGLPALAGALAMALAAFVLLRAAPPAPTQSEPSEPLERVEAMEIPSDGVLPEELLVGVGVRDDAETLPDDYAAIDGVLLGS